MNPNYTASPWGDGLMNTPNFLPPQPLMATPVTMPFSPPIPQFCPPVPLPMFDPTLGNPGLTPPYAALTSSFFTSQVPPPCLPKLSLPPPNPPRRGQSFWDPYITPPFSPTFGCIFSALLNEGGIRYDEKDPQMVAAVEDYRSLSLSEQMNHFMYARTLSSEQVRVRWQLVADILFLLRKEFPMCEVHAFGSVISGLGDHSSDIDIYADLLGPFASTPLPSSQAIEKARSFFKKTICPHSGRPFYAGPVIAVTNTRVPVLKMKHLFSSICFDLTFENRLSVQNSRLVVLYTNMDPRVFRFMVLLRYWFKFHGICSANDIKNYAVVLLALTYLMKKGIIPSVHFLQQLKEKERKEQGILENPDEIDGWDASFCGQPEMISQDFQTVPVPPDFNDNPKHLLEMLCDFFSFYANIDLGSVVVCPLLGEVILKGGFIPGNEAFLTSMLDRYKNFVEGKDTSARLRLRSPLCIQDPFVLNFNVTAGAPLAAVLKFQIACAKSVEVLRCKLQEKDISILDLFTPLPTHFQTKDLMKTYRNYIKKRKYTKEIFEVLGEPMPIIILNKEGEEVQQKNKYVKLPRHLTAMDVLMEKSSYQVWQKENSSCDLVQNALQQQFSTIFWEEVGRCRFVKPNQFGENDSVEMLNLVLKLTSLWKKFALDFMEQFFDLALKLEVVDGERKEAHTAAVDVEMEDLCGIDVRQNWKINVPHKMNNERSGELKKRFRKKIDKIEDVSKEEEIYCRMMSVQVTYPFWNRPFGLEEWKKGEKKVMSKNGRLEYKENPIEVEALISKEVLNDYKKTETARKGEGKEGKENVGEKEDAQVVEEHQRKKKRIRMEEPFTPCDINVLCKIAARVGGVQGRNPKQVLDSLERPMITLVFQGDSGNVSKTAISKMHSIIQSLLPEYQAYRLREWLDKDE